MRPELAYLALSSVLYLVMVAVQGVLTNLENGPKALLGPRDALEDRGVMLRRSKRAIVNMAEALHMFAPLALVAVVAGKASGVSALGAAIFFWARAAYFPLYLFGVPTARSIAWTIGVVGIAMTGWSLLV